MKNEAFEVGNRMNEMIGINIYENIRTQKMVDARSLFCDILRKDFLMTLYEIRDIFRSKGKKYNHATVLHSINLYEEVESRNANFKELRKELLKEVSVRYEILYYLEREKDEEKLKQVLNCIKS